MFRGQYTSEEWQTLQFAPLWVYVAVAGIEGGIDEKETMALAKELGEAMLYKDPLVQEVLLSVGSDLDAVMRAFWADARDVLRGLRDAADVLDRHATPEQIKGFKSALLLIGKNIAEASTHGVFHRTKVSDKEAAVLTAAAVAMRAGV